MNSQYRNMPHAGHAAPANHDLYIVVKRGQKLHQAFDRKLIQPEVRQCRDFRLRDAKDLRNLALLELTGLQ